jgi:hypothetical protein
MADAKDRPVPNARTNYPTRVCCWKSVYSAIGVPTVIVGGHHSPGPLQEIVGAVAHAISGAKHVVLRGQCHVSAPEQLARLIEAHADSVPQLARSEVKT